MRVYHRENPFHRIEQWNGSYFRPAALSEVGTYLLVQHHTGHQICDKIRHKCNVIDTAEEAKDNIEQEKLAPVYAGSGPGFISGSGFGPIL